MSQTGSAILQSLMKLNSQNLVKDYTMATPLSLQRRFFITMHYDTGFLPSTVEGMVNRIVDFLDDLSILAREDGKLLKSKYSIVKDKHGAHVHAIVNWLPTFNYSPHAPNSPHKRIKRDPVLSLIESNWFKIDNKIKGIKFITDTPKKVEKYIFEQPKSGQSVVFEGQYIASNKPTKPLDEPPHSYYTRSKMLYDPYDRFSSRIRGRMIVGLMIAITLLLISLTGVFL